MIRPPTTARAVLLTVMAMILTMTGALGPGAALAQEEADRAALEERLEQAREQLEEAARELAKVNARLYTMETVGSHGKKPLLGVLLGGRTDGGALEVVGVTPGGGAQAAGIKTGDKLLKVNGVDLTRSDSAMHALKDSMADVAPGDVVSVEYLRDGGRQVADVVTQAKGVYIMSMTGSPLDVDVKIEGLEALEEMAERIGDMDFDFTEGIPGGVHGAIAIRSGLRLEQLNPDLAAYFGVSEGVLVLAAADEESPLKSGDVLLGVNGEPIKTLKDAHTALRGDGVASVDVLRNGARQTLQVDLSQAGVGGHVIRMQGGGTDETVEVVERK